MKCFNHPAVILVAALAVMTTLIRVTSSTKAAKQIEPDTASQPSDTAPLQFAPKTSNQEAPNSFFRKATDQEVRRMFFKLAFNSSAARISKWPEPIKLKIVGAPTPQDLETIGEVIEQLNKIVKNDNITVSKISTNDTNLSISFIPEPKFKAQEPGYTTKAFGFVRFADDDTGAIQYACVLVSSTEIDQFTRSRLIQDLLIRALGLPEPKIPGQWIFSSSDPLRNPPDPSIEESLKLLYNPQIKPGMNQQAAATALQSSR